MKKKLFLCILTDALLCACCALATVCVLPSAYEAPFILPAMLIVEIPFAFFVCRALYRSEKTGRVVIICFAVVLLYFLLLSKYIIIGAKLVWFSTAYLLSIDFSFIQTPVMPDISLDPDAYITLFLFFAAAIVTIITALLLIKGKSRALLLLIPVPAFIPAMIYTDSAPALYIFAMLLVYWGGVLFGRERIDKDVRLPGLGKSIFVLLLALVAILLPFIMPESRFEPIPFEQRRGVIDTFGRVSDNVLGKGANNPKVYDLTAEGDRDKDEKKAFSVCSSSEGTLLLRTHSYGLYAGSEWKSAWKYTGEWNSMLALGETQGGGSEFLRIRDAYFNERLTPYGFQPKYDITPEESFIRANGRTAYYWLFSARISMRPAAATAAEDEYFRFAVEQYTLPDSQLKQKLRDTLTLLTSKEWVEALDYCDEYTAAKRIATFVKERCTYSLTPGYTPEGRDFVEYFLRQNRKGYCVHFASATTALLQAVDIPARFVVGYCVRVEAAEEWIDVPNSASHAWAEIYIKGVGWVPIESTAGFSEDIGLNHGSSHDPNATQAVEGTPDVPIVPPEETPAPTKRPQLTHRPIEASERTPKPTVVPDNEGGGASVKAEKPNMLWLLCLIPAIALLWQVVGIVIKKRRERSFMQEDSRAAVLAILRYLADIRRHGGTTADNAEELGNEAAFSRHNMEDARKQLLEVVEKNKWGLCKSRPIKRFIMRWVLFKI